jgi:hypothetical protein
MTKPRYFIGIDLHKTVLQVGVLDHRGEISEEFRLRLDTPADGQEAIRRLTRWRATGRFVVEALGLNRWQSPKARPAASPFRPSCLPENRSLTSV